MVCAVVLVVVAGGCAVPASGSSDGPLGPATMHLASLDLGDQRLDLRVLERCILGDDGAGRVLVKAVGEHDGDEVRLEVRRGASPVVDGEMVDEVTVTREGTPWLTQAVPVTTTKPEPLFHVDGMGVMGDDIAFHRHDAPAEPVVGHLEVSCP